MYRVSGMCNGEFRSGRPFGGCAVVLGNSLKCNFTPFNINNRCCGGVLKINNISILLLLAICPVIQHMMVIVVTFFRIYLITLVAFVLSMSILIMQ